MVFVSNLDDPALFRQHRNGAELGVSEGNVQGRFLGINYALMIQSVEQAVKPNQDKLPTAVIVVGDAALVKNLQGIYTPLDVAVLNIAAADNSLREVCVPSLFHISPSNKMLEDAEAQWLQSHPDEKALAVAWHPDFVKFAGRDLNKRFTKQYSAPMNSDAWAGWVATRVVAEAVVRTDSVLPADISQYLQESLEFDGQKGVPHTFRQNGQLRQPLLLVKDGKLLGEAPVRGVAKYTNLDSLGATGCQ